MPLALYVEAGEAAINAIHDSGLVRDVSQAEYEPSFPLASGEERILSLGQIVYLPATATGTITSTATLTCLMVALDFVSL